MSCFYFLAIMINAAMHVLNMYSFLYEYVFLFFLNIWKVIQ